MGTGGVGKSCVTVRFLKDEFSADYDPTIEENYRKLITVDERQVIINIVDTAGQQEYTALRDQHLQSGEGFLLVYAVNDEVSFREMQQLRESIINLRNTSKVPIVVAGNKCDIPDARRQVLKQQAQQWCQQNKCPYFETSAKTNINVNESFHQLVREVRRMRNSGVSSLSTSAGQNGSDQQHQGSPRRKKKGKRLLKMKLPRAVKENCIIS